MHTNLDELAELGAAGRSAGASGSAPAAGGVAGGQSPVQSRRTIWSRKDPGSTIEWVRLVHTVDCFLATIAVLQPIGVIDCCSHCGC